MESDLIEEVVLEMLAQESDFSISDSDSSTSSSSSDSDGDLNKTSENKKIVLPKIKNYIETVVHSFNADQFKKHFRLCRNVINVLISKVEDNHILSTYRFGKANVNAEKAVLMTVWYLANTETFRQIGDRFNVGRGTANVIIHKIINFLFRLKEEYICWPNIQEMATIGSKFEERQGIRGIVGAIDGCHIQINRPIKDATVYCNRKGDHSIILQGTVDAQKKFINIYCGEVGSVHDSRVLRRSSLYELCENGALGNNFLIGDSAYPSLRWLVPPFRDNGHLTENQKLFNFKHSSTRIIVENAFGLLKGRFRRLKHFENIKIEFICKSVIVACILHNLCLTNNDFVDFEDEIYNIQENFVNNANYVEYDRRAEVFREMFGNNN